MANPGRTRERLIDLLCAGLSLREVAVEAGVSRQAAWRWWAQCGRMELELADGRRGGLLDPVPVAVAGRGRVRRALSSEDRAVIAAGLRRWLSYAEIGASIGRDKSVVWREVRRNRGPDGGTTGAVAHRAAHERRRRPKAFKLLEDPGLCRRIEEWMDQGWSPRLIAQMLAVEHREDPSDRTGDHGRVSHETIYQALYVQTRGGLRADLHRQLSLKRRQREARTRRPSRPAAPTGRRSRSASDPPRSPTGPCPALGGRPDRGRRAKSAVGTLVERSTRFTILLHLPGRHDADTVAEAMIREMGTPARAPAPLDHLGPRHRARRLRPHPARLGHRLYFCDPHSPWQRGTNENTNRLLRHWLAKGTDLSVHSRRGPPPDRRHPQRPTPPYPGPADPSPSAWTPADHRQHHDRC